MSKVFIILCWLLSIRSPGCAQEDRIRELSADDHEQRMLTERTDQSEDEEGGLHLDHLLRFRLPINMVDPERLLELPGISRLQVRHFELYRALRGPFIDVMELQAIPSWDPEMVRRILPYVRLAEREHPLPVLSERLRKGEHLLLFRTGGAFRSSGGSLPDSAMYSGPMRTMFRYNYRFGTLMQWGLTMEKDPGEFLWNARRGGPDLLSGHVAVRDLGVLRSLVLGDYQVSMGQGLIHWQGISFGMGSDAMSILRQAPVIKPYNGTDENRFHRGVGLHLRHRNWDGFVFHSADRKDANITMDSVGGLTVTSLLSSGLHRTAAELVDRDALIVRSTGAGLRYSRSVWHIGWQGVFHRFGLPLAPDVEPYRLYAMRGDRWFNQSLSWGGTFRNLHAFGEAALDIKMRPAIVQGLLVSLHRDLDVALLLRRIDRAYRAWQADAHTAQGEPMSESGGYLRLTFRPVTGVKLDSWLDMSRFPMLKYRLDAPSFRRAYLLSLQWQPDKRTRLLWRWQGELAERNLAVTATGMRRIGELRRSTWRCHVEQSLSSDLQIRVRADASRVETGGEVYRGALIFADLLYRPPMAKFKWTGRFAWYEADDFSARLYAYEHDVPFQQSMPAFHGRGIRMYMLAHYRPLPRWQASMKAGILLMRGEKGQETDVRVQVTYRSGGH